MTTVAAQPLFTPDDVLRLESEGLYELVDGRLVEKRMSALASKTAGIITTRLITFIEPAGFGEVYPEQTFKCFPEDPDLIRRPDIAFVVASRLSDVPPEGHVPIAPDLVVEVVSPNDSVYELDRKLLDYRSAGVKLVWVVNPNSRMIRVYRPDHSIDELIETETISGESVLPGFSSTVKNFLPSIEAPASKLATP